MEFHVNRIRASVAAAIAVACLVSGNLVAHADPDAVGGAGLIVNDDPNAAAPTGLLDLRLNPSVVYRITAWAKGLKPNSTAVIQETYARTRLQD